MSDGVATVTISQRRYEELLDTKARCQVLIDVLKADKYIHVYDVLLILGEAELVQEFRDKEDEDFRKWEDKIKNQGIMMEGLGE